MRITLKPCSKSSSNRTILITTLFARRKKSSQIKFGLNVSIPISHLSGIYDRFVVTPAEPGRGAAQAELIVLYIPSRAEGRRPEARGPNDLSIHCFSDFFETFIFTLFAPFFYILWILFLIVLILRIQQQVQ